MLPTFFKTKAPIQLKIETPCSEHWEEMKAMGRNRFCEACSKQVIDFTLMSDEMLIIYLEKHSENTCGRFTEEQLNRKLTRPKAKPLIPLQKWMAAFVLFFNLLTGKLQAQEHRTHSFEIDYNGDTLQHSIYSKVMPLSLQADDTLKSKTVQIKGRTYYENSILPIEGMQVKIEGEDASCETNGSGDFALNIPDSMKNDTLFLLFSENDRVMLRLAVPKDSINVLQIAYPLSFLTSVKFVSPNNKRNEVEVYMGVIHIYDAEGKERPLRVRSNFQFFPNLNNTQETIHPNLKGEMNQPRVIN